VPSVALSKQLDSGGHVEYRVKVAYLVGNLLSASAFGSEYMPKIVSELIGIDINESKSSYL